MRIATNIAIAVLIVVWLVEGDFDIKVNRLKSSPVAVFSILLFLLYLIGLVYTQNIQAGIKYLETKASLLIFPIILGSAFILKESLYKTLSFFSWSCVIFSLIALLYQIKVVNDRADINYIFSDGLVLIYSKQAVYYSLYVAFSILVFLNRVWSDYSSINSIRRILYIFSICFLLLFLFLLASRTSLLILILLLFSTAIVTGYRKGKLKIAGLMIASIFIFFGILSYFFPQTLSRFESLKNIEFDFQNQASEYHFAFANTNENWNGLNLRLAKWICALDVIKDNPLLGVGTGDIKDDLVEAYISRKFYYGAEKRFDPHNQYLETTVGIGITGLILLCLFYLYPLYLGVKNNNWLCIAFSIFIISCSLTESVLSSSEGIIFICFFTFLFMRILEESKSHYADVTFTKQKIS